MARDCRRHCGYAYTRRPKRRRIVYFIFILLILIQCLVGTYFVQADRSPYHVLGVSRDSSQKEIQKCYKSLCLKYHPDKNVNKSMRERALCEARFKEIQNAYALIGDEQSRSSHDVKDSASYSKQPSSYASSSRHGSDPVTEALFRAFRSSGPAFYFARDLYDRPRFGVRTSFHSTTAHYPTNVSFKSIYYQKVLVPLDKLFTGAEYQFELVDNLWTRWKAAIRGKIIFISLYQGLIYSFPIFRSSKHLAAILGLIIVHATLPKPNPLQTFPATLPRGSKGQTTVKFASTKFGQPEIIFELKEAPHENYARVGNDLYTSVSLTCEEVNQGCKKGIPPLDPSQAPIQIDIPPDGQLSHGDTIRVKGEGWPIKNAPGVYLRGDLIVEISILPTQRRKFHRQGRFKFFNKAPRSKR